MLARYLARGVLRGFNKQIRCFSSKVDLVGALTTEIEYEEKEYEPISAEEKKVFFKNSGFEFIESPTSSRMELKKSTEDFLVTICYHARSPMPEDTENKNEGPNSITDFQILINKLGKSGGFLIEAVVVDSVVQINQIHIAENVHEYHAKFLTGKIDPDFYQGPDFSTLDDHLQNSFYEFINELGVTEECANFIETSAVDKDQQLYINWLKTTKNVLV